MKIKKILTILLSLIVVGSFTACGGSKTTATNTSTTNTTQEPKQEESLVKINFNGSITPTVVKAGEKVVIAVQVENLDGSKTIDGIRLLFSNTKFLEDGLTIVNIMSGGVQDGRSFKWQNEGMKIAPKEKRTFQIVAKANKPGAYSSIIQIKPIDGIKNYSDPDGNEELNAKFTVTQ